MKSIEAKKILNETSRGLLKSGIEVDKIVKNLKKVREYALEEQDPTVTKVLRLTYEHIAENETFLIPIPQDEVLEGQDELLESTEHTDDAAIESLDYLLSLISNAHNPANREEIKVYRDLLKEHAY